MSESPEPAVEAGENVVRAVGELHATAHDAASVALKAELDHEEVKGWLSTILKVLIDVFK